MHFSTLWLKWNENIKYNSEHVVNKISIKAIIDHIIYLILYIRYRLRYIALFTWLDEKNMNIEISKNTYSKLFLGWFVADAGSFINKTIFCRVDSEQNSFCCGCFSCITYHYYPSHFLFPSFVSSKGCCCNHIFLRTAQVIIRHLSDAMFNNKNNFHFLVVYITILLINNVMYA